MPEPQDIGQKLASALIDRLASLLPHDVALLADQGSLVILVSGMPLVAVHLDRIISGGPDQAEQLAAALTAAMSAVQDEVSRLTRSPWPRPSTGIGEMAMPDVRVCDDELELRFRSEDGYELLLTAIPVHDVIEGS
jgi:hypothetical protein